VNSRLRFQLRRAKGFKGSRFRGSGFRIQRFKVDTFVKSQKVPFSVIPAKAGIQEKQGLLDPGSPTTTFGDRLRRGDGSGYFLREHRRVRGRKRAEHSRLYGVIRNQHPASRIQHPGKHRKKSRSGSTNYDQASQNHLCLPILWAPGPQMAGPLPGLRRMELPGGGDRIVRHKEARCL
jgi:hypothetical protein